MRYAVVLTIAGRPAVRVVELWVEDLPEDAGGVLSEITAALEGSPYAARLSTAGMFLANRKIIPEGKLRPGYVESPDVATVAWGELVRDVSTQMNLRVPGRSLARWKATAAREGVDFSSWARRSLDAAASAAAAPTVPLARPARPSRRRPAASTSARTPAPGSGPSDD